MPLTAKGRKILGSMEREYGSKRGRSVFYASKNKGRISGVDAEPGHRLAYYASLLPGKESQYQTPEGYRIYKNVPIARTGSQTYLGREIKGNPGYKPEWNIGDDDAVEVYRPLEEVTSPETVASFEGKSVLDDHPTGEKALIDALDEYDGYSKGHAQHVRVGEELSDGETPLIADLLVKHPELNVKVDSGVRDISCGYTFLLDKDAEGRLVQRQIRGNHIAVVPEGRAGSEVGIKDAKTKVKELFSMKSVDAMFRAIGFQNWAKDARPEAVADALEEIKGEKDEQTAEEKASRKAKDRKAARKALDAAIDRYIAAKDAEGDDDDDDDDAANDDFDGLVEKLMKEGKSKEYATKIAGKVATEKGDDAKDAAGDEDENVEELEEEEKANGDRKSARDDAEILPSDERSETDYPVKDAVALLQKMRPVIAKSKDKGAKDAFNALARRAKGKSGGVKDADPFGELVHIGGAKDSAPEPAMFEFFNGKSYADGLAAWNEYQKSKGAR